MSEKFDAIIVGAGVAGLSTAHTLAKAGLKVIVIEKGHHPGNAVPAGSCAPMKI